MTAFRRVTVTIPEAVLKAADQLAGDLDRSRSWVVAEAVRVFAAARARDGAGTGAEPVTAVGESRAPYTVREAFRAAELSRLQSDLAMTPEQRVRVAEELARTLPSARPRPPLRRVLQFDSYEDYLEWRRFAEVRP